MKIFNSKYNCSGCTACMDSCPNDAILMVADSEGFKYPEINETKCLDCGLCQKVCPFHKDYNEGKKSQIPAAYAAKYKDDSVRLSSSSGGMFTALSNFILGENGVVYGAAFDDDFRVCHQKAENMVERDKFKGSKYVQSDLGKIFLDVKTELDNDKDILFTGTPCQIAGLRAYLGHKKYEKLILCDLVCLGTPSPLIWSDYINLLLKNKTTKLKRFNFRDKGAGWHKSRLYAMFADGSTMYNTPMVDLFDSIFYQHIVLRPSCHACVFTNFDRVSDITIADFWGIEKCKPDFDDNKGVSLVLINTKKGEAIFENVKECLIYESSSIDECKQRHLTEPAKPSPKRDVFWKDYYEHNFKYVAKKYTNYGFINRVKHKVKHNILKPLLSKLGLMDFVKSKFRSI